jgi:hypothetical protein
LSPEATCEAGALKRHSCLDPFTLAAGERML